MSASGKDRPSWRDIRDALDFAEAAVDAARSLATRHGGDLGEVRTLGRQLRKVERAAFGPSEVYVVLRRDVALVKIGVSTNVEQRLSSFRRASGGVLELMLRIPGTRADEQALHHRFAEYRKEGEWFAYSRALKEWIHHSRSHRAILYGDRMPRLSSATGQA